MRNLKKSISSVDPSGSPILLFTLCISLVFLCYSAYSVFRSAFNARPLSLAGPPSY